jgi:hypothetical protein
MSYSRESPFANCVSGAPGADYLSRAILDCRGAPTTDADTAFMGLTSCRWMTIAFTVARWRPLHRWLFDFGPTGALAIAQPERLRALSELGRLLRGRATDTTAPRIVMGFGISDSS